jgi:hypothetical protein
MAEAVTSALDRVVPKGKRMFAFVVASCARGRRGPADRPEHPTAAPAEPEPAVVCGAPACLLSTSVVDEGEGPEGVTLSD